MASITKPNTFSAGTTASASEVNDNFDTIYNDYNGNITNANIAAAAAIADTKLAQLTTANKVAATAIEDKFLRNDGNDTTSGVITAAGLTIDGTVTMFGTATEKDDATVYQEDTDGIIVAIATSSDGGENCGVAIYAEVGDATPDVLVAYNMVNADDVSGSEARYMCATYPCAKEKYWSVSLIGASTTKQRIEWIPLG